MTANQSKWRRRYVFGALLALAIAAAASLMPSTVRSAPAEQRNDTTGRFFVSDLADKVIPSIVTVYVNRDMKKEMGDQMNQRRNQLRRFFQQNPDFRDLMPQMPDEDDPNAFISKTSGSGVVISSDGYILTNQHVIGDGKGDVSIAVTFWDESKAKGADVKVVASDALTDLALLKVSRKGLTPIKWGDSDKLRLGERVLAIGSPLDLRETVTDGIVGAKHREITEAGGMGDMIQTNAVINPGSSGGALLNFDGELVGINRLISTNSGRWEGYGFAIPANDAKAFADQVMKTGKVTYGYIGVEMDPNGLANAKMRDALGLPDTVSGVLIKNVTKGQPAESAGMQAGDVVVEIENIKIESNTDLLKHVAHSPVGSSIKVKVMRLNENNKPETKTLSIKVGVRDEELIAKSLRGDDSQAQPTPQAVAPAKNLGMTLEPYSKGDTTGLKVNTVAPGSVAEKAGLQPGDILMQLARRPLRTEGDVQRALDSARPGRPVFLQYLREGAVQVMPLEVAPAPATR